jgi:hypothetical protein
MGERTDTVTSPMTESMIADENKNREHDRKKKRKTSTKRYYHEAEKSHIIIPP